MNRENCKKEEWAVVVTAILNVVVQRTMDSLVVSEKAEDCEVEMVYEEELPKEIKDRIKWEQLETAPPQMEDARL